MAGKTAKGAKSQSKAKAVSGATRAGLQIAPARMQRALRAGRYADRIGSGAGVFMAGAMEYLISEIVEAAGNFAEEDKFQRIKPRHI